MKGREGTQGKRRNEGEEEVIGMREGGGRHTGRAARDCDEGAWKRKEGMKGGKRKGIKEKRRYGGERAEMKGKRMNEKEKRK